MNGQTAWALFTKTERFRVHIVTKLADEDARNMRMTPARTLEEPFVNVSPEARGYLMPRGGALLPIM